VPFLVVAASGREELYADAVIVALPHVPHVRAVRAIVPQLPQVVIRCLKCIGNFSLL